MAGAADHLLALTADPDLVEIRCGDCGAALPTDATTCLACGRTLGTTPAGKRPTLLIWAAVAAAAEVALTLLIMRSCR